MTEVRLDAMLSQFGSPRAVRTRAASVDELLDELEARYPRLRHRLRDETRSLRPFVKLFVNGEEVPRDAVSDLRFRGDESVDILHSIQGG